MRIRTLIALLALLACEVNAQAGRTGQAKSAEVLARRQKASPRGGKEWGGKSMAFIRGTQKQVRRDMRRATPGSELAAGTVGRDAAAVSIRDIVGKHLGLTHGQLASKDRRHQRAVAKELRRMLREVRTARSSGRPFREAFPGSLASGYRELENGLTAELASRKAREAADHRTR